MKILNILICLFLLVVSGLTVGCNRPDAVVEKELDAIESIVISRPDSALHILNRLDSLLTAGEAKLQGEEQTARYALLKSQTYDKNWIDLTSDSLIRIAFDYYIQHGNDQERMKSSFYLAAIQRNCKDYSCAYFSYQEAERLCQQLEDYYFLRLVYGNLSEICHDTYSMDALKYAQLCYETAKKVNDRRGMLVGELNKGLAFSLVKEHDSAEFYFRIIMNQLPSSDHIIQSCLSPFSEQCMEQHRFDLADSLLHLKIRLSSEDYGNLACLHARAGRQDSADYYISLSEKLATEQWHKTFLNEKKYVVAWYKNDYKTALDYKNKRIDSQNSIITNIYKQSVSDYQRKYELQQKEIIAHREKIHKLYFSFVCVILLILLITVSLYFYYKNRASRQKIEEYLEAASVLTHTLMVKDNRIKNLEGELSDQQSQQLEMQAKVQKLFAGQFAFIDSICSDMKDTMFDHKQVYERLQNEIQKLTSDEQNQSQLEAVIDEYFNNIMKRLRATGIINGNGAQLLSYMIARFRNKSIMLLMDIEEYEILKKRKSRLKEKLRNSGLAEAKEALSYISDKEE